MQPVKLLTLIIKIVILNPTKSDTKVMQYANSTEERCPNITFYTELCSATIAQSQVPFFHVINLSIHFPLGEMIQALHKSSVPTLLITDYRKLNELIKEHSRKNIIVILNNIEDIHNLLFFSVPIFETPSDQRNVSHTTTTQILKYRSTTTQRYVEARNEVRSSVSTPEVSILKRSSGIVNFVTKSTRFTTISKSTASGKLHFSNFTTSFSPLNDETIKTRPSIALSSESFGRAFRFRVKRISDADASTTPLKYATTSLYSKRSVLNDFGEEQKQRELQSTSIHATQKPKSNKLNNEKSLERVTYPTLTNTLEYHPSTNLKESKNASTPALIPPSPPPSSNGVEANSFPKLPNLCFRSKSKSKKLFGNWMRGCDRVISIEEKDLEITSKPTPYVINPFRGFYNHFLWNSHSFFIFLLYNETKCRYIGESSFTSTISLKTMHKNQPNFAKPFDFNLNCALPPHNNVSRNLNTNIMNLPLSTINQSTNNINQSVFVENYHDLPASNYSYMNNCDVTDFFTLYHVIFHGCESTYDQEKLCNDKIKFSNVTDDAMNTTAKPNKNKPGILSYSNGDANDSTGSFDGVEELVAPLNLIWRLFRSHQSVICSDSSCYRRKPFTGVIEPFTSKNRSFFDFSWLHLSGAPLRIVLKYQPPYIEYSFPLQKWRGCNYEFLKTLIAKMRFTASIFPPTDGRLREGAYRNGSYASALGDLIEDRADINFNYGIMNEMTARHFDYTSVSNSIYLCFTLQQRGLMPQYLVIFRCFTAFVWFFLLAVYVAYFVVFELYRISLLNLFETRHSWKDRQIIRSISVPLAVYQFWFCLAQKHPLLGNIRAGKILFLTVMLSAMIFATVFQSGMVTLLSKRGYYKDIDTIRELDEAGIFISTKNGEFFKSMFSGDQRFNRMTQRFVDSAPSAPRSKVTRHALNLLNNSFVVFEIDKHSNMNDKKLRDLLVKTDTHFKDDATLAWLSTEERLDKNQIWNYDILNKSYHIHIIKECALSFYQAFTLPRYSVYQSRINAILIRSVEAGLFTKWERDATESDNRFERLRDPRPDEHFRSFSTADLQIAFIVLTFGLIFSSFGFILEYLHELWQEKKQSKSLLNGYS